MTNGTKGPRGCSKGKECEQFHPKMCPSSIKFRECLNESCCLYHVKGTARMNSRKSDPKSDPKPKSKHQEKYDKPTEESAGNTQEDFLGMLKAWQKEMMATIDQKIQEACFRPVTSSMAPYHPMEYPPLFHQTGRGIPQATPMMAAPKMYIHPTHY